MSIKHRAITIAVQFNALFSHSRQSVFESRKRLQWRQPTAPSSEAATNRAKARRLTFDIGMLQATVRVDSRRWKLGQSCADSNARARFFGVGAADRVDGNG